MKKSILFSLILITTFACQQQPERNWTMFKEDVDFLQKYTDVFVLSSMDSLAQVAVVPSLQGRVMTSTAKGPEGLSYGWINRELIASGENNKHINAFGGEDRFWMGPEGGQFSIFFNSGDPFDLEHWYTPEPINEGGYKVVDQSADFVHFNTKMNFVNYSQTSFDVELNRRIQLLDDKSLNAKTGMIFDPALSLVAFESENIITNIGQQPWEKESGLLSIWILGMYNPSPTTTIVIPFVPGMLEELGPKVNDEYFGKVPSDRLIVKEDILFFKGDGRYRSKIGLSPYRATNILAAYDESQQALTLVTYNKPDDMFDYVNSMWEIQDQPYAGDVINSYNDGPPEPGADPLGPFWELETSSPAAALLPGESLQHIHTTIHVQGDEVLLDKVVQTLLDVTLEEIKTAF